MRTTKALEDDGLAGRRKLDFSSFCDTDTAGKSRITQKQRCLPVRRQDLVIELTRRFSIIRLPLFSLYDPPGTFDHRRNVSKCFSASREFVNVHLARFDWYVFSCFYRDSSQTYISHEIICKNASWCVRTSMRIACQYVMFCVTKISQRVYVLAVKCKI